MNEQALESAVLRGWHERLVASIDRATSLADGLTVEQLNWKPGVDRWSIAQCFEHMLVAADEYGECAAPAVERARLKGVSGGNGDVARHTLVGRIIMWLVAPNVKRTMKSPKLFVPSQSEIGGDILERFVHSHEAIVKLVRDCDGLALTKVKLGTPEVSFIRINAADVFEVLASHAERHLSQAERVRASSEFPG